MTAPRTAPQPASTTPKAPPRLIAHDDEGRRALRARLETDLRARLQGEVRFDPVGRALYATDASPYAIAPHGVVFPKHADDVRATLEVARAHGVPLLMRGGGTSLAGQTVAEAIVVDVSRHLTRILRSTSPRAPPRSNPA